MNTTTKIPPGGRGVPITTEQERVLADSAQAVIDATEHRDRVIAVVADSGVSHYAIARACGLSAPGVAKIVERQEANQ